MTTLYLGWGFKSDAGYDSFRNCWLQACQHQPQLRSWPGPVSISVLHSKAQTPAALALRGWAGQSFPGYHWSSHAESDIQQIKTPSTSERLLQRFATGSVSEALALLAAHRSAGARDSTLLLTSRIVSEDRRATLAIATHSHPPHILETGVPS
jgi:hypothetical protein